MTLISAYIELFIRGKKTRGKCPGQNVRMPSRIWEDTYKDISSNVFTDQLSYEAFGALPQ